MSAILRCTQPGTILTTFTSTRRNFISRSRSLLSNAETHNANSHAHAIMTWQIRLACISKLPLCQNSPYTIPFQLFVDFWLIILVLSSWPPRNYKSYWKYILFLWLSENVKSSEILEELSSADAFRTQILTVCGKRHYMYVTLATASLDRFLVPKLAPFTWKSSQYVTHQMSLPTNC